jgi:cell division inhibitor SulA
MAIEKRRSTSRSWIKRSGEPVEKLVQERLQARRRLIKALDEAPGLAHSAGWP